MANYLFTECHQRAAIWLIANEFLKTGGGKKNSGTEKVVNLLKVKHININYEQMEC